MWGAIAPESTDVARSLYVLGCANRAAYMTTYRETVEAPRIEAPRLDATPKWVSNVGQWFDNLLYNCVSNGGSDFAPEQHVKIVRAHLDRKSGAVA
jgi:hypothetical protein